ncbi:hypothetical protein [uncultured Winogradskyella sp.]|uniref:hypothetical protein n=1 Tax=uncultured Winogradskyella sp. TaxID=395353 RepID=UPI0026287285|nr:hypothetical protein [uncultured Winogradskyella sp.]|tara:strand:+ start:12345 stop:12926 length:582 start_codon:yes stop_codon:yes gene_type:complete
MKQDIRDLYKNESTNEAVKMSEGHQLRFLQKLEKELPEAQDKSPKSSNIFTLFNVAASVVVLLGLSFGAFQVFQDSKVETDPVEVVDTEIKSLGDVSPDFKRVEDYYLASINLELSKVQLTPENKELFDGYVARLKELNDEYKRLTIELNENGPNEATLDALIENLKYRLKLVMRLKDKLNEFNLDTLEQQSS